MLGLPAQAAVADHGSRLDVRLTLIAALGLLTPRQRAAVVARYWEQLSEAETAAALGCSVSAVKAATGRGLGALRSALTPDMECAPNLSREEAAPGSNVTWSPDIDHVTWLTPTPGNLALLTFTPPAGFTKIPYSELAQKHLGPIS